jgi:hypothetical protein
MFGKNSQLIRLQLRKQLLLAESELNRAQFEQERLAVRSELHALTRRIRTVGWVASAAAALLVLLKSWRRPAAPPAAAKPSWFQTLLKGAGLVATFWSAARSREHDSFHHPQP